jgi:hypothetical protein
MIARIWHGWTTPGNAATYESQLKDEIFVGIQNRRIQAFKSIQLLRREIGDEVEFVTIMLFDSWDAVREFSGEDYTLAVVPENARAFLSHFDEESQHYEVRGERINKVQRLSLTLCKLSDEHLQQITGAHWAGGDGLRLHC